MGWDMLGSNDRDKKKDSAPTGSTAPRGALDVNGVALTKAAQSLASATIDFGLSNLAATSVNCQAMTLNNIKDGGTYSVVVTGATAATYSPAERLAHFRIKPQS